MIEYQGIGAVVVTAKTEGVTAGALCRYTAEDTVETVTSGEEFHGVCLFEKNGTASVQVKGFVTLGYTGTAPGYGYVALTGDSAGGVAVSGTGEKRYLVTAVNTTEKTVTFCM